jgi:hypothetical protein
MENKLEELRRRCVAGFVQKEQVRRPSVHLILLPQEMRAAIHTARHTNDVWTAVIELLTWILAEFARSECDKSKDNDDCSPERLLRLRQLSAPGFEALQSSASAAAYWDSVVS